MTRLKKLYDFLYLQVILWHSDRWTDWNRLRLKYDGDAALDTVESEPPTHPPVIPEAP